MKIVAAILTYNEGIFLDYALQSVYNYVDHILVVDCAMQNVLDNGGQLHSTDGTLEIIEKWKQKGDKITMVHPEPAPKIFSDLLKPALEKAKELKGDWFFLLCGDEIWPESSLKPLRNFLNNCQKHDIMGVNVTMNYFAPDFWHYKDFYGPRFARITEDACMPFVTEPIYWPSKNVWQSIELDKVPAHVKKANIDYPTFLRVFHYSCVGLERVKFKYDFYRTYEHNKGSDLNTHYINKNWDYFKGICREFTGKHPDIMLNHPLYKERMY